MAARTIFRSSAVKSVAAKFSGGGAKTSRSAFSAGPKTPLLSPPIFRCPVELSGCLDSLQPFHTATASSLMTSMLSISQRDYGWLSQGIDWTR